MGKLTDNLLKIYKSRVLAATAGGSDEIDLELPRGYVAKIQRVIMRLEETNQVSTDNLALSVTGCLIRDPDDATTYQIPEDTVQHDVICDYNFSVHFQTDGLMCVYPSGEVIREYNQEMDVITARNLRHTVDFSAETDALKAVVIIEYTLEKVNKTEILELLDIL